MSKRLFLPREDELLLEHGTNSKIKRKSWQKLVNSNPELKGRTSLSCQRRFQKLRQKQNQSRQSPIIQDRAYTAGEDEAILRTIASLPGAWRSEPYWRDIQNPILADRTKSGLRCRARKLMERLPDHVANLTTVEIAALKEKYNFNHKTHDKGHNNIAFIAPVDQGKKQVLLSSTGITCRKSENKMMPRLVTGPKITNELLVDAINTTPNPFYEEENHFSQNEDLVIIKSIASCSNKETWKSKAFWAMQNLQFKGKTVNCIRNRAKLLLQNLHDYKDLVQPEDMLVLSQLTLKDKRMVHEQLKRKNVVPSSVKLEEAETAKDDGGNPAVSDNVHLTGIDEEVYNDDWDVSSLPLEYREAATDYYHTMRQILSKLEISYLSSSENVKEKTRMTFAGLYAVHGFISGQILSAVPTELVRRTMIIEIIKAKYTSPCYADAAEFLFYAMAYNAKHITTL